MVLFVEESCELEAASCVSAKALPISKTSTGKQVHSGKCISLRANNVTPVLPNGTFVNGVVVVGGQGVHGRRPGSSATTASRLLDEAVVAATSRDENAPWPRPFIEARTARRSRRPHAGAGSPSTRNHFPPSAARKRRPNFSVKPQRLSASTRSFIAIW